MVQPRSHDARIGRSSDEAQALRAAVRSGRVGFVDGKATRTFHCHLGSITRTSHPGSSIQGVFSALDYVGREGQYASKAGDIEATGGRSRGEIIGAFRALDQVTRRKNGRLAITLVTELPVQMDQDTRRIVADRIGQWFEKKGHPVAWAIHADPQPHLHLLAVARTSRQRPDGGWDIGAEGARGRSDKGRLLGTRESVKEFRAVVAELVNDVARERGIEMPFFHGGRLRDTGISRPAKRRLPAPEFHRKTRGNASPVRQANARIDAGEFDQVRADRRAWSVRTAQVRAERLAADARKKDARITQLGGVSVETAEHLAKGASPLLVAASLRKTGHPRAAKTVGILAHVVPNLSSQTEPKPLSPLSAKQTQVLLEIHQRLGLEPPDLTTHEGRAMAFGVLRGATASARQTPPNGSLPLAGPSSSADDKRKWPRPLWLHPQSSAEQVKTVHEEIAKSSREDLEQARRMTSAALAEARRAGNDYYRILALEGGLRALSSPPTQTNNRGGRGE